MTSDLKPHPCHDTDCPGTCRYVDDEFRDGTTVHVWACNICRTVTWEYEPLR